MGEIESLGIKRKTFSLRGSLADHYCQLVSNQNKIEAEQFIKKLLSSRDKELIKIPIGENIVIGLYSEKGMYFPDW